MKIMFLDTETGGLDSENHSLLTIGACIWEDGNVIDEIEILISKDKYKTDPISMKINQIDLKRLEEIGISEEKAIQRLEGFCDRYFYNQKVFLGGHNISFDIAFIKRLYANYNYEFEKRFSHKKIDTVTILYFLYLNGDIDENLLSFDNFLEKYNISIEGERHTALCDAKATAFLFNQALKLKRKNGEI